MASKTVSAELIRRQAEEIQGLAVEDDRAAELAAEVTRLSRAVREAAAVLEFDDEPLGFAARMRELAGKSGQ